MKTNRLILFAALILIFISIFTLSACNDNNEAENSPYEIVEKPIDPQALEYALNEDGASYAVTGLKETDGNKLVIPDKHEGLPVTKIAEHAFVNKHFIESAVIADSVTYICKSAFGCLKLTNLTLGAGVKEIEQYAFGVCPRLVEIYNRSSLDITAGSKEHGGVAEYAKAVYTSEYTSKVSVDDNGFIVYTDGDEKSIIRYLGSGTNLVIPDDITEVYYYAFIEQLNITSVTIGKT